MAARTQTTCYPSAALSCQDISKADMCVRCNTAAAHSNDSCCTSAASDNGGSTNTDDCTVYCVTLASSNTVCPSSQAYCSIGQQTVVDHGDINTFPITGCLNKDEFIHKTWTANAWNALINELDTAEILGKTVSEGSGGTASTVTSKQLITGVLYNQIVDKINNFAQSLSKVSETRGVDTIKNALAKAFQTGYAGMKFNGTVCDVCNSVGQTQGLCSCNCPCACGCSCGCACTCACPCTCSCPCYVPCQLPSSG